MYVTRYYKQDNPHKMCTHIKKLYSNNCITITGLPQLGYTDVEPIVLDEVHISLGGGPDGYKAEFREVTAKGVSALRVKGLRTQITADEVQLQLALSIPKIRATAKYRSSGTLILVQASGAGDYWGEYGSYLNFENQ